MSRLISPTPLNLRRVTQILSLDVLKDTYFALFHNPYCIVPRVPNKEIETRLYETSDAIFNKRHASININAVGFGFVGEETLFTILEQRNIYPSCSSDSTG